MRIHPSQNSRGKGDTNQDSAKGIVLSIHSDWRTDLQVTKRVQTADVTSLRLPRHIAKVGALRSDGD